jgi:hypothetical protein
MANNFVADFSSRKVRRGRITNARTTESLEFLYNPTSINEKLGATYVSDDIPGGSDPLLTFASGKAKVVTFSLQLCGESSLRRRGKQITNDALRGFDPKVTPYDITGEIEFFKQFCYPTDPNVQQRANGGPDRLLLSFGRVFQAVPCLLEDLDVDMTEFTPDLDPSRAVLKLTLKRYVTETVYSHQVWGIGERFQ